MWGCEDVRMWRWEDVKRVEDVRMWRWEDVKMWGCEHEKMWRCEDEQMWRWEDVKMRRCEDMRMWRCEDVRMRRCEDLKMLCEDVKMWRCEDVKGFDRPPLLEEPFAQTLSGITVTNKVFIVKRVSLGNLGSKNSVHFNMSPFSKLHPTCQRFFVKNNH